MQRTVKTFGLISILLCNMMGSSTFLSSRYILQNAVSSKVSLLIWFVSALISILFGLCYAEFGATYPVAGGDVVYLSKAFTPVLGTIYSICTLLLVLPTCCVFFCKMIHKEIAYWSPSIMVTAIVVLSLCIAVVLIGNNLLLFVSKISFFLKVLTVLFFFLASFYTIFIKKTDYVPAFSDPKGALSETGGFTGVVTAMLYGMWGFDGWNCGNYMADEIFSPETTFKLGIALSIVLAYAFISIINVAFLLVVPYDIYVSRDESFIVAYLKLLGVNVYDLIISFVTIIAPLFGSLLGTLIVYKGVTFSLIGHKVQRSDLYSMAALVVLTLSYIYTGQSQLLLKFMQVCTILFYTLCCYGLLILRYKKPDLHRPYKVHLSIPILASMAGTILFATFCLVDVQV